MQEKRTIFRIILMLIVLVLMLALAVPALAQDNPPEEPASSEPVGAAGADWFFVLLALAPNVLAVAGAGGIVGGIVVFMISRGFDYRWGERARSYRPVRGGLARAHSNDCHVWRREDCPRHYEVARRTEFQPEREVGRLPKIGPDWWEPEIIRGRIYPD